MNTRASESDLISQPHCNIQYSRLITHINSTRINIKFYFRVTGTPKKISTLRVNIKFDSRRNNDVRVRVNRNINFSAVTLISSNTKHKILRGHIFIYKETFVNMHENPRTNLDRDDTFNVYICAWVDMYTKRYLYILYTTGMESRIFIRAYERENRVSNIS